MEGTGDRGAMGWRRWERTEGGGEGRKWMEGLGGKGKGRGKGKRREGGFEKRVGREAVLG